MKVVIITGASSGIGKSLVEVYYEHGFNVVMAARNLEKMQEIVSSLPKEENRCLPVKTDVSKEEDCINLIEQAIKEFGQIDILINNAGISMRALFVNLELQVIKKLMAVNFWGAVFCTKHALPHLLKSKGSVVAVSSIAGYVGLPARTGYSSSKAALQGFFNTLRTENLKTGLHVMVAAPGFTTSNIRKTALMADGSQQGETPRNENNMMSSEEVARKIYRAVRKRKRSLILTATGKFLVLYNKIFPKLMDRVVYNQLAKEPDSPFK